MDYKTASEKMRFNKVRAHVKKFLPSPTNMKKWSRSSTWTKVAEETERACQKHGLSVDRYLEILDRQADMILGGAK